uniref:rho guanine nucleotide exchange factor 4-like isoform X1 n=1 Tax=Ciona intestinalis TaxID=7719 RepID=UPI000EF4D458|nr:rho guanine nucleotide exchange factor 4-like isoform X1 [Ciona intestinalis]|eukprot:XP_026691200.1 rho guanine nucleotide exchange factor 4-like isoform X1 [Ciona intestinalis]
MLTPPRRSRANSIGSHESTQSAVERRAKSFQRKKSVMHGIMKRGRTVRKTMRSMQISEAEGQDDGHSRGHLLTNEQRLRMYVLKEILETEEDYTQLLQFIVDVMIPSLQKCSRDDSIPSCTSETVSDMLSNIREVHKLHVTFYASLKEAMDPYPYHTNCIGELFMKHHFFQRNDFAAYGQYCANFNNAQKISYKLQEDPAIMELINDWKNRVASKTRKFLHLEGFIISPVQRLCKYPLLLRELKKFTNESHPDRNPVEQAMNMMEDVTASVNETQRRAITMQAIRDVDNLCDSWEQSGCLTKQGFMTKRGGSVKSWNIRWFTLSGYQLCYYNEPADRHPLKILDLTSYVSMQADADHVGRPHAFSIKMPDRSYYMYTTSSQERRDWISILQWKFSCIDRSRKQAHQPFETVIFSSLSSFLHPKSQKLEVKQVNDTIIEEKPTSPKINTENELSPKIRKNRPKSFFRMSFKRRSKISFSSSSNHDT